MIEPDAWTNFDDFLSDREVEQTPIDAEKYVSYSLDDLWPAWQRKGRCFGVGTDYFFGDEEQQPTMSIKQVRRASKLCDVCPVFVECLTWALENNEEYGVWASTSGRTRRKIQQGLSAGSYSVPEVVEDYRHGRRDKYTHGGTGPRRSNPGRTSTEQGSSGLPIEDGGQIAAADR